MIIVCQLSPPTDHVEDVRTIVQRAVKDLTIENALKTYEAIWLSKLFELRPHVRTIQTGGSERADKEVSILRHLVISW